MVRVLSFLELSRDFRRSRGARCAFWLGVVSIDSWEPLDFRSHERGVFTAGLASKSRALEATNPEVDGPSFRDGAAALAADARGAGGKAATTVVGWAGAGVCCDVAPLRAAPAYPEAREYAACPPSQLGQWSVPLQLLDSCSCSPHFAHTLPVCHVNGGWKLRKWIEPTFTTINRFVNGTKLFD
ncbi:uncharacterized protein [Dermacentor andersoni]|uniref:uncharacterized protein n=1 Tax=Dermacentor andersoni TaxID=34620 RepID=UPI002416116B|nr:uncharacterized protein LOC129385985 [Dermacentor andersoni]